MASSSVVNVSEYTAPIRRWFLVVLIAAILGSLAGFALFSTRQQASFAEARVQVRPLITQGNNPSVDVDRRVNMVTEEAIASSARVAERAEAILAVASQRQVSNLADPDLLSAARTQNISSDAVAELLENITVTTVSDSQILIFEAYGASDEEAANRAQAMAVGYLDYRESEANSVRQDTRATLEAREEVLKAELARIYANAGGGAPSSYLITPKEQELAQIGQSYADLDFATVDAGDVLSDGRVPSERQGLPIYAGPAIGGLLGLALGLALVFVIDRQDDRLRSASTELAALGLPVLGNAPVHSKSASGISLFANNSSGADAYRRVQGSLLFNLEQGDKSLIVVAGVKGARASSFVASNLAAMSARSGRRTLLVGADLRKNPLNEGVGLSDIVIGKANLANSIENLREVDPNLDLLGGGTATNRPADILQSEAFGRLLSAVHQDYDLVMVEAPAILEVADAMDIARLCEGTVVVVDSTTDNRKDIADSISQVRNVGSSIVGLVITEPSS